MVTQTKGDRVKEIRLEEKLSLEKFGSRVGVGKTAISSIEHGINALTDQMALSICREFGYNEEWLRTGKGPKKPDVDVDEEYGKICADLGVTDERAKKVIINYAHMSPEGKKKFWNFIDALLKE